MIEFESADNLSLEATLQKRGYEIQSENSKDGIILRFHASYEFSTPERVPIVSLIFTDNGILHAPGDDNSYERDYSRRARLKRIAVNPNNNKIEFSFVGVNEKTDLMYINLTTVHKREIIGKI
ncbi:hypothetical protein DRH13_02490 [Candidatus Woesebacteria bacterium]|nr:MAG: hypothetical protein DRH13_02490 [Candidatus Woesebacteria bacterium]